MKVPLVDLRRQYCSIRKEIDEAVGDVLANAAFILGEHVRRFEEKFARYCNSKAAIGVGSGTAALHMALLAHGIGSSDEVITVPNSFFATAEAISLAGAVPVFVDADEASYTMDPSKIESAITKRTKAIIPVHLYGQTADMRHILDIAERRGLAVIEDACQAHGSKFEGKDVPVGTTACFSFYPAKNLGAAGEGGAIVTNDEMIASKIRLLRAHGEDPKNTHSLIGYNHRMEGIQGAVLGVKLKYLDQWNGLRRKNAKLYDTLLEGYVKTPREITYHVYHLYVIRHQNRDEIRRYLQSKGISTGIHYPTPIHLQPAYNYLNLKKGKFRVAERAAQQILSLPMFPELTEEEIQYVADSVKESAGKSA